MRLSLTNPVRKMCSLVLLFTMLITMVFGSNPASVRTVKAEGINLVKNPGFEDGTEKPDYWIARAGAWENKIELDTNAPYEGLKSAKMYVTSAATSTTNRSIYDQTMAVNGGSKYTFSAEAKVEGYTGSVLLYLNFYTSTGAKTTSTPTAPQTLYVAVDKSITGWQKCEIGTVNAPADAATVMVTLMLIGGAGTGNVWFDDVEFAEQPQAQQNLAAVSLAASKAQLYMGQTSSLTLSGTYDSGDAADLTGAQVAYTSADTGIATVSDTGVVTAVAPGTAAITADVTLNGVSKTASTDITVLPETLDSVVLTSDKDSLSINETAKLSVQGILSSGAPANAQELNVTYTSSDSETASVDGLGTVTALKAGEVTINAHVRLGNMEKTAAVSLSIDGGAVQIINLMKNPGFEDGTTKPDYWVPYGALPTYENKMIWDTDVKRSGDKSFRLYTTAKNLRTCYDQTGIILKPGYRYNFSAYYKVSGYTGSAIIQAYTTDAAGKNTMLFQQSLDKSSSEWQLYQANGLLVPAGAKTAFVRFMMIGADAGSGFVNFDDLELVEQPQILASANVSAQKSQLYMGQTTRLTVSGTCDSGAPADLSSAQVVYTSSRPDIATVDSTGAVTAVAPGTASVTASVTLNGITKEASADITVLPETLDHVTLTAGSLNVYVGETVSLTPAAFLSNGNPVAIEETTVTYSSSDEQVATVDSAGNVKALKGGSVTITADVRLGSETRSASVNIVIDGAVLDKLKVLSERTEILLNQNAQLSLLGILSDGAEVELSSSNASITYASDNAAVAQVDGGGVVTALSPGTATITATVNFKGTVKTGSIEITSTDRINSETLSYSFKKLGLYDKTANPPGNQPTQEGWNIKDATCNYLAQPFGITVQAEQLNGQINLEFDVPQTGYYLVKFTGTRSRSGGVGSIIVDGIKAGEFNFSADAQSDGIVKDVGYVRLDQGKHTLTLKSTGRGEYGSKWYYLYPTQLDLEKVLDFQVSAGKNELLIGQSTALKLTAAIDESTILDIAQTGIAISYRSSNGGVAGVNAGGVVTPVAAGTATVTASAAIGNARLEKSMQITVSSDTLAAVSLEAASTKIPYGSSAQLTLSGLSSGGRTVDLTGDNVVFTSGDTEILTVDQNGTVNALKVGTTTVSAAVTIDGVTKTGSIEIEVTEPALDSISLSAVQSVLPLGRTSQLKLTAVATNGKEANLSGAVINYTSSDENVATVNAGGLVTLAGVGIATITVDVVSGEIERRASVGIEVQDPADTVNSKTRATYYTDGKVEAARENVNEYSWAKALKDNAVLEADKYVALGDEFLWDMVTPQSIPRSMYHMQRTKASVVGCPVCGTAINNYGSYPWLMDPVNDPWKLVCPNCKTIFPTNDFEAYYKSGLDEHGIFNRELADKSLLVNTLYPEKGETWGVDDGYGWTDANGNVFTFIAFYDNWALWYGEQGQNGIIQKALESLRDAYIYTGDLKYAHAGIILLDRIADVYPDMDVSAYLWKDGFDNGQPDYHTCQGKILNDIWETFLATAFASSYDAFFPALKDGDAANVVPFLAEKSDRYGLGMLKYSANGIKKNIEDNILRQVLPGVQNSQIRGNQGMHQAALAMAAVVLDEEGTTKEMLDFNFQAGGLEKVSGSQYPNGRKYIVTGGNILGVLTNDVDRDGSGNESAPGYNQIWLDQMTVVADVLDGYDRYPEYDMYRNPQVGAKFMKMFKAQYPLIMEGKYMPSIGDSGGTGLAGISLSVDTYVKAFEEFGDPEFAQVAYMLNKNSISGIHGSVFSQNPDMVAQDIKNIIDELGPMNPPSQNLTGYGFAALRDGADYSKSVGFEYNFLQMSISGSSGKEHKEVSGPALFYRSAGPGDYISFSFTVPETAEYEITLQTMLTSLYGKYVMKIDGEVVGQEYDGYATATKAGDPKSFGTRELTAGEHIITFECTGKNEASSNYVIGLMKLVLTNVKEAEELKNVKNGNTQRDVWVYYGRNTGHGHKDTLNLGIHAFGLDLAPDLGYPDYTGTDPKRLQWINNTISHNTVVVDKAKQKDSWVGVPSHFDENDMVSLVDVSAPDVYPQTDMYRRTTAMIKVDDSNSYSVDFFRVEGGNDHHFSFHSNAGTVTTEGLNLVTQPTGTYAGPDIPFMQVPAGENASGSDYTGPGFHYLRNVQKDENPSENFSVDWDQKNDPDVHLRLTMLGEYDDAALTVGEPPLNNASNPRELNYLVVHRQGTGIDSLFTSVIEPYKGDRYIQSISEASLTANGQPVTGDVNVRAVKVVLVNGRTDYIINSINPDVTYTVDGKFQFKGFFGVYSERGGIPFYTYVNDGEFAGSLVENATAGYTGSVVDFTRDMNTDNEITVDFDSTGFDAQALTGRFIYVENDGVRNAAYQIMGVKNISGSRVTLDIGDATTIRSWKDNSDYTKGYIYDMAPGQRFTIPLSAEKLSPLGTALLTAGETTLLRDEQSGLTVSAAYESGAPVDMNEAITEYVSSDTDVVSIKDGVMTAINPGTAGVYAKVALNGVTVQSNTVIVNVTATVESVGSTLERFIQSGELKDPLVPQLTNSLDQAEHFIEKGQAKQATKHLDDLLKHLNNKAMEANVTENAKKIISMDVNALINSLSAQ